MARGLDDNICAINFIIDVWQDFNYSSDINVYINTFIHITMFFIDILFVFILLLLLLSLSLHNLIDITLIFTHCYCCF